MSQTLVKNRAALVAEIPHLRRYARSLARDADAADELVQSCLERALKRFHLWQPERRLRPWLFAILHNLFVDGTRRRASAADPKPLTEAIDLPVQNASQEQSLAARRVLEHVDLLPVEQRDVILLVAVKELTYAEAAEVLEIPPGTLMSRLHRARSRLREELGMEPDGAVQGLPSRRRVRPSLRQVK